MNVIKHLVWILFWGNRCTCTVNLEICCYTLKSCIHTRMYIHVLHACVCILCRELLIALDVGVHLTCNLTVSLKLSMTNHLGWPSLPWLGRGSNLFEMSRSYSQTACRNSWKKKGYEYEARYIKVIKNWRCTSDERGLSQLTRCRFNYELLNFILDELMPWHKDMYDFSLMEVNR